MLTMLVTGWCVWPMLSLSSWIESPIIALHGVNEWTQRPSPVLIETESRPPSGSGTRHPSVSLVPLIGTLQPASTDAM